MTQKQSYPIDTIRHSTAHLLAAAVLGLYPKTKLGVGPVIEHGFFYDLDARDKEGKEVKLTPQDLLRIDKRMRELARRSIDFRREEMPLDQAIAFFKERDQDFKVELLTDLKIRGTTKVRAEESQDVNTDKPFVASVYFTGNFVDLCRGPHVSNTRDLGVWKLTTLAGAYWRGSEKNPQLQRVYGLAFQTKEELDAHEKMLEEAERRDHRKIGREMELFHFDDMVGKGLPLWLPKGTIMREEIEKLALELETRDGYNRVVTPHLGKEELYITSGHLPYYAESMYPAMKMDDATYYLKAMNCPHHHVIYNSKKRSYRDLPIRLAEYGTVYRNELSGTLAGLLRVRMLSMNDAHIYCRCDQIEKEFESVLKMVMQYFKIFNLKDYWFRLSKWDPINLDKYINEPENWNFAEDALRRVLEKMKVKFVEVTGEAAFYGPKVDVQFKSVVGREETMSTVQLDFAAKKRFHLSYTSEEGKDEESVFVIHRAPLGTHERFMAFLIEHYAGAFPTWLSPVQVAVIPVGTAHVRAATKLGKILGDSGVRASVFDARETVGYKIRKAEKQKVPYMLVIGDKEKSLKKLSVRRRGEQKVKQMTVKKFLDKAQKEINNRSD